MWNAFGSGSDVHGRGGGYVSRAKGWEFVSRSRLEKERGRGQCCSPRRSIASPAYVASFFEEPTPGVGAAESEAEIRAQANKYELQWQHSREKKKCEELQKRHGQEKDEWIREKEALLRQIAEIQGGENRRILLDFKSVLEEVQSELKKEETRRSDLQQLYTRDRCAWELERAELKCRIALLYHEVKARRESNLNVQEHGTCDEVLRLNLHSPTSESSCLNGTTDQKLPCISETDAPERDEILCKLEGITISTPGGHDPAFVNHFNNKSFQETTGFHNNNNNTTCGHDKKKYTSTLNAALKEIAKVSEELCSYQDEIRQKSNLSNHSNRTHSISVLEEYEDAQNEKNKAGPRCEPNNEIPAFNPEWSAANDFSCILTSAPKNTKAVLTLHKSTVLTNQRIIHEFYRNSN
ncbi:UNVERIFIED_CONTAM: hypothetical protein FKN15_041795 [Acipenser sinensis]